MSSSGSGNNQHNIQNVPHDVQNSKDPTIPDKASEDVGFPSQVHRDSNSSGDLSSKDILSCAVRSSVQTPHFLFDVSCEDGIQLFVDLNSSPSDWIESLNNGVHICSNMNKPASPSYHEVGWRCCCKQMKNSSLVDSHKEVDNEDLEEGSHPVTIGVDAPPESNELNGASSFAKHSKMLENNKSIIVDDDIHNHPSLQQMNAPPDRAVVHTGLSASPSREIRESSSNTFDQHKTGLHRDFACQPKSNRTEHCGLVNSVTCTKMQTFQVVNHTKSASPSCLVNAHSSDPTDVNHDSVEIENNKASTSGKYDRQISEAQEHQKNNNQMNGTSLPNPRNYESGHSIEIDNHFTLSSHEAAQQAVEIHSSLVDDVHRHKSSLPYSSSNSVSSASVATNQNGVGHCTSPDSDDLDNDVRKCQSTSMEVLGRIVAGDQRKNSECLDFRDSMTDPQRNCSSSESRRGRKRKRLLNGTEGQSQLVRHDEKIKRITRRFTGKFHDSRRRSSRFFTKV